MTRRSAERVAEVFLAKLPVGLLHEDDRGLVELRLHEAYRRLPRRPVLGQWFEDHPSGIQRGSDIEQRLPSFFANLVPEGHLSTMLHERLGIPPGDHLGLLCAVGRDLPGAVIVQLQEGEAPALAAPASLAEPQAGLRFSLAGVQLKFSMLRAGERFLLPGSDERGTWIVKIAYDALDGLAGNEWTTMEWARRAGFDVPTTELRQLADLANIPVQGNTSVQVFVIRRFDRGDQGERIHQEDFQQILGRGPERKYDDLTYESLAALALRIIGDDAYREILRRLALMVATGNADAHAKNWSVVYPDQVHAQLSPLYDQVFTAQWQDFSREMAFKLGGSKLFSAVTADRFRVLAQRVERTMSTTVSPDEAVGIVEHTIARLADVWATLRDSPQVPPGYREGLTRHWRSVPLLQPHALLI